MWPDEHRLNGQQTLWVLEHHSKSRLGERLVVFRLGLVVVSDGPTRTGTGALMDRRRSPPAPHHGHGVFPSLPD